MDSTKDPVTLSICHLISCNAANFAYAFCFTTMCLVFVAAEMKRLFGQYASSLTGVTLSVASIFALVSPLFGTIMDRSQSKFGKRRPAVFGGAVIAATGALTASFMYTLPEKCRGWISAIGFATIFFGLTWVTVGQNSLIYDVVPETMRGKAAGLAATMKTLGSASGVVTVYVFSGHPLQSWLYFTYAAILLTAGTIIWFVSPERPEKPRSQSTITYEDILESYTIDFRGSFWLVTLSRATYYVGLSVQGYLIFFFRDILESDSKGQLHEVVMCAVLGQIVSAVTSPVAGQASDRFGRKLLIYYASVNLAFVYTIILIAPLLLSNDVRDGVASASPAKLAIFVASACFGFGNGSFRAADYALAMDCLPKKLNAAKELAIWNLGLFLGLGAGNLLAGFLLNLSQGGTADEPRYAYWGYVLIMVEGILSCLVTCFIVSFIPAPLHATVLQEQSDSESSP